VLAQSNSERLQAALAGEVSPQTEAAFSIPVGVAGQVSVGGSAEGYRFLQAPLAGLNTQAPDITVEINLQGLPDGLRRLCNGEVDFAFAHRDINDEEASNCEA